MLNADAYRVFLVLVCTDNTRNIHFIQIMSALVNFGYQPQHFLYMLTVSCRLSTDESHEEKLMCFQSHAINLCDQAKKEYKKWASSLNILWSPYKSSLWRLERSAGEHALVSCSLVFPALCLHELCSVSWGTTAFIKRQLDSSKPSCYTWEVWSYKLSTWTITIIIIFFTMQWNCKLLRSEITARRQSDSRSREEQTKCPTKQLRLTWHVVCLLSAKLPEKTFQFPFPSASRVMKGRGRIEYRGTFLFLSSQTIKTAARLILSMLYALSSHIHQQDCLAFYWGLVPQ